MVFHSNERTQFVCASFLPLPHLQMHLHDCWIVGSLHPMPLDELDHCYLKSGEHRYPNLFFCEVDSGVWSWFFTIRCLCMKCYYGFVFDNEGLSRKTLNFNDYSKSFNSPRTTTAFGPRGGGVHGRLCNSLSRVAAREKRSHHEMNRDRCKALWEFLRFGACPGACESCERCDCGKTPCVRRFGAHIAASKKRRHTIETTRVVLLLVSVATKRLNSSPSAPSDQSSSCKRESSVSTNVDRAS